MMVVVETSFKKIFNPFNTKNNCQIASENNISQTIYDFRAKETGRSNRENLTRKRIARNSNALKYIENRHSFGLDFHGYKNTPNTRLFTSSSEIVLMKLNQSQ